MNFIERVKIYFTAVEDKPSKQQLLPGIRNEYTYFKLLVYSILMVIVTLVAAIGIRVTNNKLIEYELDYTECASCTNSNKPWTFDTNCQCTLNLNIEKDIPFPIYIHYGMKNYYQNLGVFKFSKDYAQFSGAELGEPVNTCVHYRFDESGNPIAPCGDLANTIFNDTFHLFNGNRRVNIDRVNLNLAKASAYENPPYERSLSSAFDGFVKPPFWPKPVYELDTINPDNNGFKNKAFISWMTVEQFSTFRKLYGVINQKDYSNNLEFLPKGNYQILINYNYPVAGANFKKSFFIGTSGIMGQKNRTLEYFLFAVLAIWILVFIFSVIMLIFNRKKGRVHKLK